MRRSIILSNRIFNFLNAIAPGPVIAFFWMGVNISLFQKQVYRQIISTERPGQWKTPCMFHRTMSAFCKLT